MTRWASGVAPSAAESGSCEGPLAIADPRCTFEKLVADPLAAGASNAAGSVASSALDRFAEAVAEGVGDGVQAMTTLWVRVPNPKLDEGAGTSAWLADRLWWYMAAAAVLGLIIAGARLAWNARAGMETLQGAVRSLLTLALVSGGGIALVNVALQAGDGYSAWILRDAGGQDFGKRLTAMMGVLIASSVGVILLIVLGLVVIVCGIVQIILLITRSAALIILVGLWPLSASATHTSWGQQWFKKITGWIIAMILYKPAAATIYAAALHIFGNEKGLLGALMGMAAMVLAIAALPALMRLCVPLVGGLSEGAAGGGAALMTGAAMTAGAGARRGGGPSGAAPVPPSWGSTAGGSSSRGGGSGPSGSRTPGAASTGPGGGAGAAPAAPAGAAGKAGAGAAAGAGGAAGAASAGGTAAAAGPAGAAAAAGAQLVGATAQGAKRVAGYSIGDGSDGPTGASGRGGER